MTQTKDRRKELYSLGLGSWFAMRNRCLNPNGNDYAYYGGRGITCCPEWATFAGFLRDMGARPPGMSLERKDVNLGYTKENCIWLLKGDQAKNTRKTVWFSIDGELICMKDACRKRGVSYSMVKHRVMKQGWDHERALSEPPIKRNPKPKGQKWIKKS